MTNLSTKLEIGGTVREYTWNWENKQVRVVYETLGNGTPVLLLPAFSTVSMRSEMAGIAKLLSPYFQTNSVDFPGFGDSSRLPFDYQPEIYHQFLEDFISSAIDKPCSVVAAGHSAAYVLKLAQKQPNLFSRIALIAPTWRGPFPTMGMSRNAAGVGKDLIRSPLLGQGLYKLNTNPSFLSWMYSRHVYVDNDNLTPEFIQHKWQNTQKPGARFAPAAFVTGNLDAIENRDEFVALVENLLVPVMVVIGESAPPKSRSEMDAIATLPNVINVTLAGSLGMHEEYPSAIVEAILPFLRTVV